jgi:hypothetical protein
MTVRRIGLRSRVTEETPPMPASEKLQRKVVTQVQQEAARPIEPVAQTRRGYMIYAQDNGAGGITYWSDEHAFGTIVWDTTITERDVLLQVIQLEDVRLGGAPSTEAPST